MLISGNKWETDQFLLVGDTKDRIYQISECVELQGRNGEKHQMIISEEWVKKDDISFPILWRMPLFERHPVPRIPVVWSLEQLRTEVRAVEKSHN